MIQHDVYRPDDDGYSVDLSIGLPESHFLVHEGRMHAFYTEALAMADQADWTVLLRVGSKPLHLALELEALAGLLRGRIYRAPTLSANGTPMSWGVFNDIAAMDSPMETLLFLNPTVSGGAYGTAITNRVVLAAAQGNSKITSSIRESVERVFRPNTDYLIRQTALAAGVSMTLVGAAYEEEI